MRDDDTTPTLEELKASIVLTSRHPGAINWRLAAPCP
jgi:hypothetical protein